MIWQIVIAEKNLVEGGKYIKVTEYCKQSYHSTFKNQILKVIEIFKNENKYYKGCVWKNFWKVLYFNWYKKF